MLLKISTRWPRHRQLLKSNFEYYPSFITGKHPNIRVLAFIFLSHTHMQNCYKPIHNAENLYNFVFGNSCLCFYITFWYTNIRCFSTIPSPPFLLLFVPVPICKKWDSLGRNLGGISHCMRTFWFTNVEIQHICEITGVTHEKPLMTSIGVIRAMVVFPQSQRRGGVCRPFVCRWGRC